ncbi:MAG: TetR/AcrR family transcriptional regulator [Gammaproteobacteria bacterium]
MNKPLLPTETEPEVCGKCKTAGRPKASELEARNQNLIQTAAKLFLRHGYGNVSLETIAREAHVAVRTIYVKFGGKPGLLRAAIDANRERFYSISDVENDRRPLRESVTDFARHFFDLITTPEAVRLKRMVIAESESDPEMVDAFLASAPNKTRDMLLNFFRRPDNLAQLRPGLPMEQLPNFLLNCITGDQFTHLVDPNSERIDGFRRTLPDRLELFFHAVLLHPDQ